ncbi:centrosomal protein CCDC61 isoform X4 [Syngnathoides biaculeatus]|uniref:centrosomal protein CCDC61 isoform X4 n=1 Tax=Syngnathoides biaculeatus TaxID=300417 RepID=UPI002ADE650F|nr:centrosomal protein CCDC61 isoform X4 [Syngnathoides biaculeatus]XP_061658944.1 centrosomal protein CCDC61 isoform X4 [Syngnathoides biaculeatus]
MEEASAATENVVFRGAEFAVKVEADAGALLVEISDSKTADQWKGEFDPAYIEDLTRKTGNFKQFPIFCSMLESAVRKTSDCVTLDLLTYADLELLRNRKAGVVGRPRGRPQSSALTAKRYLILIYTVEFDRIHYPLPLPYVGKPDPAALQKEIRTLRAELSALTSHGVGKAAELEIQRLRAELAVTKEEKEAIAKVLERLQLATSASAPGGRLDRRAWDGATTSEEEKAKSRRSAAKRCQEQRLLVEQLDELRASECALRLRVNSLTDEVALLRRGSASKGTPVSGRGEICRLRDAVRGRSGSRERRAERGRRADSAGPRRSSPSPAGSRAARFDPTAYVQDRQRRLRESELKKQLKVRRDLAVAPERGRSRSREICPQLSGSGSRGRSLSVERRGSRNSSESSLADPEETSKALRRGRKQTSNGPSVHSGQRVRNRQQSRGSLLARKPLSSTPTYRTKDRERSMDTGAELLEIDARLQALQDYMRDLDTGR